jgi:hypothetical protein
VIIVPLMFIALVGLFGLVVLVALGVLFGARVAALTVLIPTAVAVLAGGLVLLSFLNFLGGIFR